MQSLFAALCLGRIRPFFMLSSYCDETGHAKDPAKSHLGLAGILANSNAWEQFDQSWKYICREEGVCEPFHMTDFAAFQGQFADNHWKNEDKRRKLIGRYLDAIESAGGIPVGAIIDIPAFNSLTQDQRSRLGGDKMEPYYVAFQWVTRELAFASALTDWPPEKVSMVYAKLKKFTGVAEELWIGMKEQTYLGNFMSSYARGEPADYTPLQAADLWAYELGHHFHRIIPEHRKWRYPFTRFVQMGMNASQGHKFFEYFDRARLLGCLGEFDE